MPEVLDGAADHVAIHAAPVGGRRMGARRLRDVGHSGMLLVTLRRLKFGHRSRKERALGRIWPRLIVFGGKSLMNDEKLERALQSVDPERRAVIKKLVLGAAFAVPIIASFSVTELHAQQVGSMTITRTSFKTSTTTV
jgi:hypothetical protein